ncbi:MAG: hypothetical protein IKE43_02405 [Coriobacteriales bacterium]|nr:hypothetical protein [Coriobacteriales bacterium]
MKAIKTAFIVARRCMFPMIRRLFLVAIITAFVCTTLPLGLTAWLSCSVGQAWNGLGLGDFLSAVFGGTTPFGVIRGEPFYLPSGWLAVCGCVAYTTLDCPWRDLAGSGCQAMIACGSRRAWWLGICFWTLIAALLCWLVILAVCMLFAAFSGGGLEFAISEKVPEAVGYSSYLIVYDSPVMPFGFLIVAPCVFVAMCFIQLSITCYKGPMAGLLASFLFLFLAVWSQIPIPPYVWLVASRLEGIAYEGLSCFIGILVSLVIATGAAIAGWRAFSWRDFVNHTSDLLIGEK